MNVCVLGTVVHDEPSVGEIEAVRASLKSGSNHLLNYNGDTVTSTGKNDVRKRTLLIRERRELINILASVDTVGNTETKVEVKALDQTILEEVSLNHSESFDGLVANGELDSGIGCGEHEKETDRLSEMNRSKDRQTLLRQS